MAADQDRVQIILEGIDASASREIAKVEAELKAMSLVQASTAASTRPLVQSMEQLGRATRNAGILNDPAIKSFKQLREEYVQGAATGRDINVVYREMTALRNGLSGATVKERAAYQGLHREYVALLATGQRIASAKDLLAHHKANTKAAHEHAGGLSHAQQEVASFLRSLVPMPEHVKHADEALRAASASVLEFNLGLGIFVGAAATAVISIAALKEGFELAETVGKSGREIQSLSERTGVAIPEVQGLVNVFEHMGLRSNDVALALKFFNKNVAEGNPLLKAMGITTKDTYQAFLQFSDAFKKGGTSPVATQVAVDMLSRSGERMIPVLKLGGEEMDRMVQHSIHLGATIREDTVQSMLALHDRVFEVEEQFKSLKNRGLEASLPVLGRLVAVVEDLMPGLEAAVSLLQAMSPALVMVARSASDTAKEFTEAKEAVEGFFAFVSGDTKTRIKLEGGKQVLVDVGAIAEAFRQIKPGHGGQLLENPAIAGVVQQATGAALDQAHAMSEVAKATQHAKAEIADYFSNLYKSVEAEKAATEAAKAAADERERKIKAAARELAAFNDALRKLDQKDHLAELAAQFARGEISAHGLWKELGNINQAIEVIRLSNQRQQEAFSNRVGFARALAEVQAGLLGALQAADDLHAQLVNGLVKDMGKSREEAEKMATALVQAAEASLGIKPRVSAEQARKLVDADNMIPSLGMSQAPPGLDDWLIDMESAAKGALTQAETTKTVLNGIFSTTQSGLENVFNSVASLTFNFQDTLESTGQILRQMIARILADLAEAAIRAEILKAAASGGSVGGMAAGLGALGIVIGMITGGGKGGKLRAAQGEALAMAGARGPAAPSMAVGGRDGNVSQSFVSNTTNNFSSSSAPSGMPAPRAAEWRRSGSPLTINVPISTMNARGVRDELRSPSGALRRELETLAAERNF